VIYSLFLHILLFLFRWTDAEADATKAIAISPYNLKALFRRSLARRELSQWGLAREGTVLDDRYKSILPDYKLISILDIQTFIDHGGDPTQGAQELKAIAGTERSPPPEPSPTSSGLDTAPANLDVKDASPFITVQKSALIQKQGVFASREFQRGDLILAEKPIFLIRSWKKVEAEIMDLPPHHLDRFLSLHNSHTECSCYRSLLLGIFATNAFSLDGKMGVCLTASRFNHSCSQNASHVFNANTGELRLHALGTLHAGEEIFVTYMENERICGNPRQTRQDILRTRDHFTCACSVCSLPPAESKASDTRRIKIAQLWERIGRFTSIQSFERLNAIVEGIRLLKEEGYLADTDNFTNDAGLVCAHHSDWVSAKYWTHLTYQIRVAEYGEDNPRTAEAHELYLDPKLFPMAGEGFTMNFIDVRL